MNKSDLVGLNVPQGRMLKLVGFVIGSLPMTYLGLSFGQFLILLRNSCLKGWLSLAPLFTSIWRIGRLFSFGCLNRGGFSCSFLSSIISFILFS